MFKVIKHHPCTGVDDYGGGYPGQIRSAAVHDRPKTSDLESAFPGFTAAYAKTNPNHPDGFRITEAIRELTQRAEAQHKNQCIYIWKPTTDSEYFITKDHHRVIFNPDGLAKLHLPDNGKTYIYKLPGHTITCMSNGGTLVIKKIVLDSGGDVSQLYIPLDHPLVKMLKVIRTVAHEIQPITKP